MRSGPTSWCAARRSVRDGTATRAASLAREAGRRGIPVVSGDDVRQPGRARCRRRRVHRSDRAERREHAHGAPGDGEPRPRASPPASRSEPPRTRGTCRAGCGITSAPTGPGRSARSTCCWPRSAATSERRSSLAATAWRRRRPSRPRGGEARARHRGGMRAAGEPGPAAHASRERLAPLPARAVSTPWRPARTSRCTPGSTRPPRTPTRTGSCRSTRCASSRPKVGSGRCTTRSTRRPASTRPSRRRRSSGSEIAEELRDAGVEAVILTGT